MSRLIYVTNTKLPSARANSYQSMIMCYEFSKFFDEVELWVPIVDKIHKKRFWQAPFEYYNIQKKFKIKSFFSLDLLWIHNFNVRMWFLIRAITFSISSIIGIFYYIRKNDIIFSRDPFFLLFMYIFKKLGFIKNKFFYEAHSYSDKMAYFIKSSCNGLIVINKYLKLKYTEYKVDNILLAYDGVNIEEFNSISDYKFMKKEKYIILYTGRFFKWKGVYTLVKSVKFIKNNVEVILIGGAGKDLKDLRYFADSLKLNNVKILPHVPRIELIAFFDNADIFVIPNSKDNEMNLYTSPLKLFEYMVCKRPIIASNISSLKEILEDGKNAFLFEADDPLDLARKIDCIIEKDCTNMVNKAFEDAKFFTWNKRTENIVKFIKGGLNV